MNQIIDLIAVLMTVLLTGSELAIGVRCSHALAAAGRGGLACRPRLYLALLCLSRSSVWSRSTTAWRLGIWVRFPPTGRANAEAA
jgi:hypothetical protein